MTRPKRPFLVTLLAIGVLTLTIFNAIRFGTALAKWDLLLKWMPHPGPVYIAATGLFWTLGLFSVTLNLWFGWKWVRPTTATAILLYELYDWLDRIVYQSSLPRDNQLFLLIFSILFLFFTAIALSLPGSRKFFNR